jgi:hypothetical protein
LRFSARADGGYPSRLRRFGPDHAPSISCAAVFRYPAERSRNLAGFFNPATLLGFDTLRSFAPVHGSDRLLASCAHLPFAEHPTPIILSGGQSLNCHTHSVVRLTAGARRGSWVLSPRASRSLRISRRMGRYCPGLAPLSGLRTPEAPACRRDFSARRSASHGHRFRHPDAHGFYWRCRCAATATRTDAPSGTRCFSASPADPSAFVAGA